MSAEIFTRRWLGLFALLAGLIAIAPYFIHVVVGNSGCAGPSSCGALTDALSLYSRRITLVIVLVPLLVAVAMRSLTTGGFGWAFPFALLTAAGALPLAAETRDFHSAAYWSDAAGQPELVPLLFLLLLLVAFSAHPDDSEGKGAAAWRTLLGFVAVAALFVTAPVWAAGLAALPYVAQFAEPLARAIAAGHGALGIQEHLGSYANYCLLAFVLGTAGLLFSGRSQPVRTVRPMRA